MKKINIILAAAAAMFFVGCTKDSEIKEIKNVEIDLGVTKELETKAIQSDFLKGNSVLVFFNDDKKNGSQSSFDNKEYLTMTYDGSAWSYDINSTYLNNLPESGTMDAIYVSNLEDTDCSAVIPGLVINPASGSMSKSYTDFDILTAEDLTYTIEDGKLKGTIALGRKQGSASLAQVNLQISISGLPDGEWYLKTDNATIIKGVAYSTLEDGGVCSIKFNNCHSNTTSNNRYVKLNSLGDDMVAYLGKADLSGFSTLTFYLYNNTTGKTYTRTVNVGTTSEENSLISIWNGADGASYESHNTALKMAFSKFKAETVNLSESATANCYIVPSAGKYKFNAAVKGNSSESVGTVASAEVLWETFGTSTAPSVGDLVSGVGYNDGYISFTASDKKGNAVIAAKDSDGTILWSWHIWMTDQPVDQVYNNNAGTMMDRNLGATSATPGDVHALGLLYQWGRKDPFLSGNSIYSSGLENQTRASSSITWPSAENAADHLSDNNTLAYAIANPTVFIKQDNDWYCTNSSYSNKNLWSSTKTIYDPCPAGYKVPKGGYSGIWATALACTGSSWSNSSNWDSANKGMNFGTTDKTLGEGTIWYPSAGGYIGDELLYGVGWYGYYWSYSIDMGSGLYFYFYNGGQVVTYTRASLANGMAVRCCKE